MSAVNTSESTDFSIVLPETTGPPAEQDHRIIEIGVIRIDPNGTTIAEWETLVSPGRDVGPTYIHHLTNEDVSDAPEFSQVVGDLLELINGSVLVGFPIKFAEAMLTAEFERLNLDFPNFQSLCAQRLGYELGLGNVRSTLSDSCEQVGVDLPNVRSALGRARSVSQLLVRQLEFAKNQGTESPPVLDCVNLTRPQIPEIARTGLMKSRLEARRMNLGDRGFLKRVLAAMESRADLQERYVPLLTTVLLTSEYSDDAASNFVKEAFGVGLSTDDISKITSCRVSLSLTSSQLVPNETEAAQVTDASDFLMSIAEASKQPGA